jgi:hypothetical protein
MEEKHKAINNSGIFSVMTRVFFGALGDVSFTSHVIPDYTS